MRDAIKVEHLDPTLTLFISVCSYLTGHNIGRSKESRQENNTEGKLICVSEMFLK